MISVIIPTYNHLEDCLKPCIESLIKYTDFNYHQIEFIVVSNGSTDGTLGYLNRLSSNDKRFKFLEFKEPLGYTKATNEGLKISKGNLIVFLNNDIELLHQKKNEWLRMLYKPLIGEDRMVGMTCPMKGFCHATGRYFPIFFCAMTTKQMINKVGYLDEIFSPGGGEDCDWGHSLENLGYRIVQVPEEKSLNTTEDGNYCVGGFPIYHKAERTVHDVNCVSNWGEILDRNTKILSDRYRINGKIRLNLGCGELKFDDYFNIDIKCGDIKRDARDLSIFMDNSVDEIQAIHLLEHFIPQEVISTLKEWYRVLIPGGKLVLELPDIMENCKNFESATKEKRYELLNVIYGGVTLDFPHRWGWYFEDLKEHLEFSGFKNVERKELVFKGHWGYNMRIEAEK